MIVLPRPSVAGRFKLEALKADGRVRPVAPWFDNRITDFGLDRIAVANDYLDCCHIGTNGDPVSDAPATLGAPVAATANRTAASSSATNAAPFRGRSIITWLFPTGAYAGLLREVGVAQSTTLGTSMFTRALTPNVYGEAAEIELFADEALTVQYELSVHAPVDDVEGTFTLDGVEYSYVARAALASTGPVWCPYRASSFGSLGQAAVASFSGAGAMGRAYSGGIGAVTGEPAGSVANCISVGNSTYFAGDYRRTGFVRWDDTVANYAGGVRSVLVYFRNITGDGGNSIGAYQIEFTPAIPKDNTKSMLLDLVWGWGRA